ncbi:MAG: transglutaminase-like domain-containing protein [Planctomycetes bacterium]|nr:transglutaminase-like domain-containing protein [Planctomycetota bacterium]
MIIQRILAVIMILASSVLIACTSGDITFPAILGMLGLLGTWRRFLWDIRPERHFIAPLLLLILAALFALHCHDARVRADQAAAFAWQTIARYFLASMILILFLRPQRSRDRSARLRLSDFGREGPPSSPPQSIGLPPSLGLFHLASVTAAGQVLLLDDRYVAFRLMELLSVTLVILYAATADHRLRILDFGTRPDGPRGLETRSGEVRRSFGRWVLAQLPLGLLLLATVNLGWIGGSLLYRHVEIVNILPNWLSRGALALEGTTVAVSRVGFSASGKLASVLSMKEDADSSPVLTITGSANPGYLRAMAFETYHHSAWHDLSYREAITAERNAPFNGFLVGRGSLFRLHETEGSREVIVRHEASIGDAMFTPLGTCSVEVPFNLLMRDDDDIVNSPSVRNRTSYRVSYAPAPETRPAPAENAAPGAYASAAGHPPTGAQWRRMVAIPDQLDPQIRQHAMSRIFRGCTTTVEKIDAVIRHFQTEYTYALGLEVPPNRDALNHFLLEATTGYCEYFASGAAILLRLAGVPTRYVTGYLVTEQGDDSRSWIARNMDAHAWAEAWDDQRQQWVIVEATAQEGLGDTSLADQLVREAGGERPLLRQLAQALYEYGLFGVIGQLCDLGFRQGDWRVELPALAVLAGLFYAAVRLVRSRRRAAHAGSRRFAGASPYVLALQRILAAMDRKARTAGWRRGPEETLHAFAERIRGGGGKTLAAAAHAPTHAAATPQLDPTPAAVAGWYLEYAGLRYGSRLDPSRLEQLRQFVQKLPRRVAAHRE